MHVLGLPLTAAEKSLTLVREKLYRKVILPILEGAFVAGDIMEAPQNADSISEMAHPLCAKEGAV